MRWKILSLSIISSLLILLGGFGSVAFAVDIFQPCSNADAAGSSVCQDAKQANNGSNPFFGSHGLITTYVQVLAIVVAIGSVLVILIAGLRFVLSGGDPQSVQGAKTSVYYALAGIAVAAVAQLIVSFVLGKLNS